MFSDWHCFPFSGIIVLRFAWPSRGEWRGDGCVPFGKGVTPYMNDKPTGWFRVAGALAVLWACLPGFAATFEPANGVPRVWNVAGPFAPETLDAVRDASWFTAHSLSSVDTAGFTLPDGTTVPWTPLAPGADGMTVWPAREGDAATFVAFAEFECDRDSAALLTMTICARMVLTVNGNTSQSGWGLPGFSRNDFMDTVPVRAGRNYAFFMATVPAGFPGFAFRLSSQDETVCSLAGFTNDFHSLGCSGVFVRPPRSFFKIGDNPGWAAPDLPLEGWEEAPDFRTGSWAFSKAPAGTTVWFRTNLRVGPEDVGVPLTWRAYPDRVTVSVFLNGAPLTSARSQINGYSPAPHSFHFPREDNVLAVRWTVEPLLPAIPTFFLAFQDHNADLAQYNFLVESERGYSWHRMALIAIFTVFLLLHPTIYMNFPKRKEHLFYGMTVLFCLVTMTSLHISEIYPSTHIVWVICYQYIFLLCNPLSLVFGLGLLQLLLTGRVWNTIYFYFAAAIVSFMSSRYYGNTPVHLFPVLIIPEFLRIVFLSVQRKRRLIWAWGLITTLLFASVVLNALGSEFGWREQSGFLRYSPWYGFAVFLLIALLLFTREFARTARRLEVLSTSLEQEVAERTNALRTEIDVRRAADSNLMQSIALLQATLESSTDGVLVVDRQCEPLMCNRRMSELFELPPDWSALQDRWKRLHHAAMDPVEAERGLRGLLEMTEEHSETLFRLTRGAYILCSAAPYYAGNEFSGRLLLFRDVTERHLEEETRERLVVELQEALHKVRTLSGLLPICSNCKRVRDDAGYWSQIEVYVSKHSQAEFTHGLCPECLAKLFPEYYPRLARNGIISESPQLDMWPDAPLQ